LASLVGLLVFVIVTVNLTPSKYYKSLINYGIKSATGRELIIEEEFDIQLLTTLTFKASGIKFSNAEWGSQPHMASVDNIQGELALLPLLKGVLDATVVVDKPDLLLETNSSGQKNWQFGELLKEVEEAAERGVDFPLRPLIRKLHINGAQIAFINRKNADPIYIRGDNLLLGSVDEGLAIELKGTLNNTPLALTGRFDNAEFLIDNLSSNVKFDGYFGEAKLAVKGTVGPLAPTFDLDIAATIDTESVAAFSQLAGITLPDIGPLSVSMKLAGKEGKYAVSDLITTLDDQNVKAEATGSAEDLAALSGLKLMAKVDADHVTQILEEMGYRSEHPLPDTLDATIVASGSLKDLAVPMFQTKIRGKGLQITGNGEAKNIMAMEGVKADLSLEAESLVGIAEIVKAKLPLLGPLKATASIVSKGLNLDFVEIKADLVSKIIHADVTGSIGDPLKLKGVDANVNLRVDSLAWLADYVKIKLPPLGQFKASAKIASKGDALGIEDIRANLAGKNITASVSGSIGDLLKVRGVNAKVDLGAKSLAFLSDYVKWKLPPLGQLKASAKITSNGNILGIKDIHANLAGKEITARVVGSVANLLQVKGVNAKVDLGVQSMAFLSDIVKAELPPLGPMKATVNIVSKGEHTDLMKIKANLTSKVFHADLAGSIGDPLKFKGVDANVNIGVDSLAWLGDYVKIKLPPLGQLKASAKITLKGDALGIKNIKADLTGKNITAKVTGSVEDLLKVQGVNTKVDLGAQSLAFLSDYVKMDLPPLGPLKASAGVVSKGDTFEVKNIKANVVGDGIRANVTGSVGDLINLKSINAHVDLGLESLALLSGIAKAELPPLGPLNASANIVSKAETFEIRDLEASLADEKIQAKVLASVADALKFSGINANVNFNVDSLESLGPLVKQKLPYSVPIKVDDKVSSEGSLGTPIQVAAMLKSGGVTAHLTGSVAEPLKAKGIDLALGLEAESIQQVGKLAGIKIQGKDPFRLKGQFTTGVKTYHLADMHLQIGELDVRGEAAYKQPSKSGGRPMVSGKLHFGELDFSKWFVKESTSTESKRNPTSKKGKDKVEKGKIFPSNPLPYDLMRSVDANLEVTLESLMTHMFVLENLVVRLSLDNGLLSLKPMKARIGEGTFNGILTLDTRDSQPTLIVDSELMDATLRNFGGKIHLLADLRGRGESIAAMMASLNGQLQFNVREATLQRSFMTTFGKGLFQSLNPLGSEKKTTELTCGIILFDITDGIADANKKIAAQMTDVTWFGGGRINLKTEQIGFGMNPIPRKGLLHLGNYAKLVYIGGTLAQPRLQIDPKSAAVTYGKYLAAMATGGLTWALDSLWSSVKANTDVCAGILKKLNTKQGPRKHLKP